MNADSELPDESLVKAQSSLLRAIGEIEAFVEKYELEGLAGRQVDLENTRLVLFWHGPTPPLIEQHAASLAFGVPVDIRPARYSADELDREARRIIGLTTSETGGADVTGVGPLPDYSGLRVSVTRPAQIERARAAITSEIHLTFDVDGPIGFC